MTSAPASRATSPSLALYRCGSTPGPISPATWTRSPPPPPPFSFGVSQPNNSRNARKINPPGIRSFPPCPDLPAVQSGGEENCFSGILSTPGREGKGEFDSPSLRKISDGQNPVVLVGDPGADGEPEARPAFLRSVEGIEDPFQPVFGDRRPVVAESDAGGPLPALPLGECGEGEGPAPPAGHRLHPVEGDVEQQLGQLVGVPHHRGGLRPVVPVDHRRHSLPPRLCLQHRPD